VEMANTKFKEGHTKVGGRKRGTPNKFTDLKQAFLDVFERIEKDAEEKPNVDGLYGWAMKNSRNQGMFYQIISKMLPSNVNADLSGDISITVNKIITDKRPPGG